MKIKPRIIIILFAVGIWSCQYEKDQTKPQKPIEKSNSITVSKTQFQQNGLSLVQPKSVGFSEEIVVNGMIDVPPENRVSVNSFFEGYVSYTKLLIGDEVKKGQLLIKLKNPDFINLQQDFVDALADLDYQKAEFNRKSNLFEEKVIAEKVFQKTKKEYLSAKARVTALSAQIELMNLNPNTVKQGQFTSEISIYAPISGKISKLNVSQGSFVGQSDRIMEIVDTAHIHLELNVYEKDLPKINVGQAFEFNLPEASDERLPAHVKLIGAEISPQSRFVKVHAHPDNEEKNYVIGMYVTAYFEANSKQYQALPETAFTEVDGIFFVLRLNKETDSSYVFKKQVVNTKAPQNSFMPLVDYQADSTERYLAKGVFDLISGE